MQKQDIRAIVTGGASGLGLAVGEAVIAAGGKVALLDVNEDAGRAAAARLGPNASFHKADVTSESAVDAAVAEAMATLGFANLAVSCAGVGWPKRLVGKEGPMPGDFFRKVIEINLIGAMAWLNPVAEMFQSAQAGQIVGIGSVAGDRGRVGNPGYNTSKAALATYLEALRNRLTRHGVNVLTIKAGFIKTEMLKAAQGGTPFAITPEKAAEDILKAMKKRRQVIYTASIWRWIMLAIQHTPSFIFRKLSF